MARDWNLPESQVTPEAAISRRRWLKRSILGGAALAVAGVGGGLWWWFGRSDAEVLARGRSPVSGEGLYPAAVNPAFQKVDRPQTREADNARWTNFFEFTSSKQPWRYVDAFQPLPWTVEVGGLVAKPKTYDLDDLLRAFPLEERVYRHRCVEAWAMVVPWTGFPLADLLRKAEPLPAAKFVRFVSFQRPEQAPGQTRGGPWPYTEGLTLAEATNELAFLATGMYGHPLFKQHGAPFRLVVPWKYGYKSAKSIVRIELTAEQPATFWNTYTPHEYGFEANVDPDVPHPRWSQETEWMLGSKKQYPTQRYNGYGEWVGKLYA